MHAPHLSSLIACLCATQGASPAVRPMTNSGRPLTGFARPGTSTRPGTGSVDGGFTGGRPSTSRPLTSGGRCVLFKFLADTMQHAAHTSLLYPDCYNQHACQDWTLTPMCWSILESRRMCMPGWYLHSFGCNDQQHGARIRSMCFANVQICSNWNSLYGVRQGWTFHQPGQA